MARQDQANDQFSLTSFLYGGNAGYIEELYAQYQDNPASVDEEWREFFGALKDDAGDVKKNAQGASWKSPGWPLISTASNPWAVSSSGSSPQAASESARRGRVTRAAVRRAGRLSTAETLQAVPYIPSMSR